MNGNATFLLNICVKEPQKGMRTFKLLCSIIDLNLKSLLFLAKTMKQNWSFLEIRIDRAHIDLVQRPNAITQLKVVLYKLYGILGCKNHHK